MYYPYIGICKICGKETLLVEDICEECATKKEEIKSLQKRIKFCQDWIKNCQEQIKKLEKE